MKTEVKARQTGKVAITRRLVDGHGYGYWNVTAKLTDDEKNGLPLYGRNFGLELQPCQKDLFFLSLRIRLGSAGAILSDTVNATNLVRQEFSRLKTRRLLWALITT